MLSPCAANNQFVVVELCDDITIDTVQLANYEFFSGVFKEFTVSVAKTYLSEPERWTFAGKYKAENIRGVQVGFSLYSLSVSSITHVSPIFTYYTVHHHHHNPLLKCQYRLFTLLPPSVIFIGSFGSTFTRIMAMNIIAPCLFSVSMASPIWSNGSGKLGKQKAGNVVPRKKLPSLALVYQRNRLNLSMLLPQKVVLHQLLHYPTVPSIFLLPQTIPPPLCTHCHQEYSKLHLHLLSPHRSHTILPHSRPSPTLQPRKSNQSSFRQWQTPTLQHDNPRSLFHHDSTPIPRVPFRYEQSSKCRSAKGT